MLKEGDIINVKISGETQIPDGIEMLIAVYKNHKFLISKSTFKNELPIANDIIECRVDKVNCSGKIYIEVLNQEFQNNKQYSFELTKTEAIKNSLGETLYKVELKHQLGRRGELLTFIKSNSTTYHCKLISQKKSKLLLEPISKEQCFYPIHSIIEVEVIEQRSVGTKGLCYIVTDQYKRQHLIPIEKFKHYNIQLNSRIRCQIRGFDKEFNLKIEPQNPIYIVGKSYKFECLRVEHIVDDTGSINPVLIVKDLLGMEASITQVSEGLDLTKKVRAKVHRITNGRLYLYMD